MTANARAMVNIDTLLRLVPDSPESVLSHLQINPSLASASDTTGYSLLHAAASYNQLALLKSLVNDHNVDVNITDEEGETPLFAVETLTAAKCLIEELGADASIKNEDGTTAEDNALASMEDGGEWPQVAVYLERSRTGGEAVSTIVPMSQTGDIGEAAIPALGQETNGGTSDTRAPPPLPPNISISMGTMQEQPVDGENAPDPEFRRRIEELAARDDFQGEEGQKELRELITEAVGGLADLSNGRDVRRRID